MVYLSHNIAVNLKRVRTSKGMSLEVVAEQTGVSKSMQAQIERGTANPSIGVLGKIVSGLRLSFDELIQTPPLDAYLVRVEETIPIKEIPGQYRVWNCYPIEDNNTVEIYRIDILPGGVFSCHGERTREYVSVMDGELVVERADGEHVITKADAFRFESDQPHWYRNRGEEKVRFMSFFVEY